ncbi:MAG: hypothetical protein Q4A21_01105 [bacterium]|nr:hypothetical protein [bacterium]
MKLEINLKNCFGIENMNQSFDFKDDSKAIAIYAKNGTMKTSFAKTFEYIQKGERENIKDIIFDVSGEADILVDENPIESSQIFVIKSLVQKYESAKLTQLLVSDEIRNLTSQLLAKKQSILKTLSGLSGTKIDSIEQNILSDFSTEGAKLTSLTKDFKKIPKHSSLNLKIKYADIFEPQLEKFITGDDFQKHIRTYIKARKEVYREFEFLKEESFDLLKFRKLAELLESSDYFLPKNKINLNTRQEIVDTDGLQDLINEINTKLKLTTPFKNIEKALDKSAKSRNLHEIIKTYPEIIEMLQNDNIKQFKKNIWSSYFKDIKDTIEEFQEISDKTLKAIQERKKEGSKWEEVFENFESRFKVPFKMKIENIDEILLGETLPEVKFQFEKDGRSNKLVTRDLTESVLNQGEKRALYILNILFDIESIKPKTDAPTLLVIDDIADSFDYQNKYAIVEYLAELCKEKNLYLLILSHNFDFYRTITGRLGLKKGYKFHANSINNTILLEDGPSNNPLKDWTKLENEYQIISLIPLVRNISEFLSIPNDKSPANYSYEKTTAILHTKNNSSTIKLADLKDIFEPCIKIKNNNALKTFPNPEQSVREYIFNAADKITQSGNLTSLEHKITLAIASRLKAEEYMINTLPEENEKIFEKIDKPNQFRILFNVFKLNFLNSEHIKTLSRVNLITPEHIHLNSFMYEPMIDTDIGDLIDIYKSVSDLQQKMI